MSCSGVGLQFVQRPYLYERRPLRLGSGELIPHSGMLYSQPAFAALTDRRLFTFPDDHPITTPIKLYVNKVANVTIAIEPSIDASGYQSGCVNYVDYIEDIRDLLDDVYDSLAADSDHDATAFKISQMQRNRAIYGDINITSASGTLDTEYVHKAAVTADPSGTELGASGIQDIDVDEVAYQPIARPTKVRLTRVQGKQIPTQPFFPAVIKTGGSLPAFGEKDEEVYSDLGLGVHASGNKLLVTGDRLLQDTSVKVMSAGSGSSVTATGGFSQHIDWSLYPAQNEMCRYIEVSGLTAGQSPTITASGRQALYNPPSVSKGVYLTAVSETTETSGLIVQHWPTDWETTEGIDANGSGTHDGLYVEDKLLYSLKDLAGNQLVIGRSLQNGRLVFGHIAGSDTNSLGRSIAGGNLTYEFEGSVYSHAGKLSSSIVPYASNPTRLEVIHTESFAKTGKTLSPIEFVTGSCDDQAATQTLNTWHTGNNGGGGSFGVLLTYAAWGYIDYFVSTSSPTSTPGSTIEVVTYSTRVFRQNGYNPDGSIIWKEEPDSPRVRSENILNYKRRWSMNNFYSFFLARNGFKGAVNVNGTFYFQYGKTIGGGIGRRGRLFSRMTGFGTELFPPTSSSRVIVVIGFFPAWKLLLYITTNNQIVVNTSVNQASEQILVDTGFTDFADNDVFEYGPPVYDSSTGLNYLYVQLLDNRYFFCKMNSDFKIIEANPVTASDAILLGPAGILDL